MAQQKRTHSVAFDEECDPNKKSRVDFDHVLQQLVYMQLNNADKARLTTVSKEWHKNGLKYTNIKSLTTFKSNDVTTQSVAAIELNQDERLTCFVQVYNKDDNLCFFDRTYLLDKVTSRLLQKEGTDVNVYIHIYQFPGQQDVYAIHLIAYCNEYKWFTVYNMDHPQTMYYQKVHDKLYPYRDLLTIKASGKYIYLAYEQGLLVFNAQLGEPYGHMRWWCPTDLSLEPLDDGMLRVSGVGFSTYEELQTFVVYMEDIDKDQSALAKQHNDWESFAFYIRRNHPDEMTYSPKHFKFVKTKPTNHCCCAHQAVLKDHEECLINAADATFLTYHNKHMKYLFTAAQLDSVNVFRRLLQVLKNLDQLGQARTLSGSTLLDVMTEAIRHNSHSCVKLLAEEQCCTDDHVAPLVMKCATANPMILKLLLDHGYPVTPTILTHQKEQTPRESLTILLDHFGSLHEPLSLAPKIIANPELLECMVSRGIKFCTSVAIIAAANGNLESLKIAIKNGTPLTSRVMQAAARHGHLSCMEYAMSRGCEWSPEVITSAAVRGYWNCIKFALDNGCPWPETTTLPYCNELYYDDNGVIAGEEDILRHSDEEEDEDQFESNEDDDEHEDQSDSNEDDDVPDE